MQYNQPFYVAGPPTSLQFYPWFNPPPPQQQNFPMYPNNNGLSYNGPIGPYQDVIGEGDVSSVVLPDGTVQLFFVPAAKFGNYNNWYNNSQTTNGSWFIRSVNNPCILPPTPPACQQNNRMALQPPSALLCPGCQTNQGLKFHNDQCTSTVDIGLFCSGSQQRYEERPHKPCCSGVVCNAPCKCSPDCVGIRHPERYPSSERYPERYDSNMSIDEYRRGRKRNRKEYCDCVSDSSSHGQGKRRKRLMRSSSTSSAEIRRWRREKAVEKQSKKLEKERRARDHRRNEMYEKYRRRSDSDMSIDEYRESSKCKYCQRPTRSSSSGSSDDRGLRHSRNNSSVDNRRRDRARKGQDRDSKRKIGTAKRKNLITRRRRKTDASTNTNDKDPEQQKCVEQGGQQSNELASDKCAQNSPCLLSRLRNFICSSGNSQYSTSSHKSCCSEFNDGVCNERYDSNEGFRKTERIPKKMDAKREPSVKELIERNRSERGNNEIEFLKQYSPSILKKNTFADNLPACCSISKDAESKLHSACACPHWNSESPSFSPASSQNYPLDHDQYAKAKKEKLKLGYSRNVNANSNNQYGIMDTNSKTNCICPPTIQNGGGLLVTNTEQKPPTMQPTMLSNSFQGSCCSASRNDPYNRCGIGDKTNECCSVAGRDNLNDYSKGDKTASPRKGSDYARSSPLKQNYSDINCACSGMSINTKNISPEQDAVGKTGIMKIIDKIANLRKGSDYARSSPLNQNYSDIKCACSDMLINTKNISRKPDAVGQAGTMKMIDVTESPSRDVGACCNSPNMSTRDTCAVLKDSLRNIGVLCEAPATVEKCSAADIGSSDGIIAIVKEMFGIGAGSDRPSPLPVSSAPAPPAPECTPPCSASSSSVTFRLIVPCRDNCGPYPPGSSPSCNHL